MTILEKIDLFLSLLMFFSLILTPLIVYYLTRRNMKVMDKIVYCREFTDDNFILQSMRISQYIVLIFVRRTREQWPEDVQEQIIALDSKFRRPFLILIWNVVLLLLAVLCIEILEKLYGVI